MIILFKPLTSSRCSAFFALLTLLAGMLHDTASSQGIKTDGFLIASPGTLIHVNGNLGIHQLTKIEGKLKFTGNLMDHHGLEIDEGIVLLTGSEESQLLSGSALSIFDQLEIGQHSKLLISAGKRVTIKGELICHNTAGGLRLLSDNTGIASLIHSSENVRAEVQRHFNTEPGQYHMLASPVAQQSFEPEFFTAGTSLLAWYEPLGIYVSYTNNTYFPTFIEVNHGADYFFPATGYMINYSLKKNDELTKTFDGFMHQGEVSFMLSCLDLLNQYSYYNLMGNPYQSAIDWNAEEGWSGKEYLMGGKSKHDMPAWVWNEELQNFGVIHPRSHRGMHNDIRGYIPAMTGFWVQAAPEAHGELLTMDDRVRVHIPPLEEKRQPADMHGVIRISIGVKNKDWRDEVLIEYHHDGEVPGAGKKFSANPEAPQLYVVHEEKYYSLLFLTDPEEYREILLEHNVPRNSTFYLDTHIADDLPVQLILEDRHTNRRHVLTQQDAISFQSGSSTSDGRFILTVLPVKGQ